MLPIGQSPDLLTWNQTLAKVFCATDHEDGITLLLRGLEKLINATSGIITIYPQARPPNTTHHRLLANESLELQIDKYASGAYLLDPFYQKAVVECAEGVFTIADIAPNGFRESEYYNVFYKKLGLCDEVCALIQSEHNQSAVTISLARHRQEQPFSADEKKLLLTVYPLLNAIITRWLNDKADDTSVNFGNHLDSALATFGCSVLTPRECEVLQLILHGCSIKFVAKKLGNSLETIKHHRKNIYTKLDVRSQAELFYLFIASIKSMPHSTTADPLTFL